MNETSRDGRPRRRGALALASFAVAAATGALLIAAPQVPRATPAVPSPAPSVADTLRPPEPVSSPLGIVVSATAEASWAGARMLEAGGNAVDAAVTTTFTLNTSNPKNSNLNKQT